MINIISYRPLIILAVHYHIILANQLNSSFSCYLVCFLPKRFITAANAKSPSMPKDSKTGELLLEAVKKEQSDRQATRTALALERCQSSSEVVSLDNDTLAPAPLPEVEVLWERHDFESGNLLVFARGEREAITIRKSPVGRGWYIDFGGAIFKRPE